MKVKKEQILNKTRLIDLFILKSQQKKVPDSTFLNNTKFLKSALKTIYKYHINNKKILFIGIPLTKNDRNKTTNHIFIPSSVWVNGIILNKTNILTYLKTKSIISTNSKTLLKLVQKPDLVVILDQKTDKDALKECFLAKIPIISLNSDSAKNDLKSTYKIPQNFKSNLSNENIFEALIYAIIKKKVLKSRQVRNTLNNLFYIYKKKKFIFRKKKRRTWFKTNKPWFNKKNFKGV